MIQRLVLIILFSVSVGYINGQSDYVDYSALDTNQLNQSLLDYVNYQRRKKRQDSLVLYTSLSLPAKDHANYMASQKYVGHRQYIWHKGNAKERAVFYGINAQFVGENVLTIPLKKEIKKSKNRLTYKQLAKIIGEDWRKSRENLETIIDPNYTGVSHQFKLRGGYIFICQVLSSRPFKAEYSYEIGKKLLIRDAKPCKDCKKSRESMRNDKGFIGWYTISNDSLYYWNVKRYQKQIKFPVGGKDLTFNYNKSNLSLIFGSRGEIAVDLIHHEQFDCRGNGALHSALYYDGYYLGYLNKRTVRQNNEQASPDLVKVYVAQIPEFNDDYFQVDFNYNKKRRPCVNNSIIFLRPDFFKPHEYFNIPKPKKVLGSNALEILDSIEVRVPFARNKTDEDSVIFSPLIKVLDSLTAIQQSIVEISYTGVASIEGSEKINRNLIAKRGQIIGDYIKSYYPDIAMQEVFYENFIDFKEGLAFYGINEFQNATDQELRAYANANRSKRDIEELLDRTRESVVKIKFRTQINIGEEVVLSVKNIEDLMAIEKYQEAHVLFQFMANKAMNGDTLIRDSLLWIDIPMVKENKRLCWDYFVFELHEQKDVVRWERLNALFKIDAIPNTVKFLEYRLLFNLFNDNDNINVSDFDVVTEGVKSKREGSWLQVLELISGVQNFEYTVEFAGPLVVNHVIKNKYDIYKTYFVCQYLMQWGYYVESMVLLSRYARQKNHFPKLYKQYIKLAYYLEHFKDKTKYKKVLVAIKNLIETDSGEFCDLFSWKQMGVRALDYREIAELYCLNCRTTELIDNY